MDLGFFLIVSFVLLLISAIAHSLDKMLYEIQIMFATNS